MGENPSDFRNSKHPVEMVSWLQVQCFLWQVKTWKGKELFDLPTEAQWEYACRADSTTALYPTHEGNGTIKIVGERNASAVDPIAWYGGNSAVASGIENGWNVAGWNERQYDHQRASTQPVGLKLPNAWGLYDMLGNVWEWCLDRWGSYTAEPVVDPDRSGDREGKSVSRICRGASWGSDARLMRSALRDHFRAVTQGNNLGFRLVRVQKS